MVEYIRTILPSLQESGLLRSVLLYTFNNNYYQQKHSTVYFEMMIYCYHIYLFKVFKHKAAIYYYCRFRVRAFNFKT